MKRTDDFEPLFPPEFRHFEQPVREAQAELNRINTELIRLPKDKGYRFDLTPPRPIPTKHDTYAKIREDLKEKAEDVKLKIQSKVEKGLKDIDPVTAKKVRDTVNIHIGKNIYKDFTRADINKAQSYGKDLDISSDYMDKTLSNERASLGYRELYSKDAADRFFDSFHSNKKEITLAKDEPNQDDLEPI